jgi:hypothetical protein
LAAKDRLIKVLESKGFHVSILATDGDRGMDKLHRDFYMIYMDTRKKYVELTEAIKAVALAGEKFVVPDLLHLMKNLRTRLVSALQGLAANANRSPITAKFVSNFVNVSEAVFSKNAPLDRLKDYLALELFKLDTLCGVGEHGDGTALLFFLPFVALNTVVRCPELKIGVRMQLIDVAYQAFQHMYRSYPTATWDKNNVKHTKGKKVPEISENLSKTIKSPLWTRNQCMRGSNLCVALYWACWKWKNTPVSESYPLGLNRIGTHSVECFFGMLRSVMRGDARFDTFVAAEVNAIMCQRIMADLKICPRIRRFMNAGGCTLEKKKVLVEPPAPAPDPEWGQIDFRGLSGHIKGLVTANRKQSKHDVHRNHIAEILRPYNELKRFLAKTGYKDKVDVSSDVSGLGLSRFFAIKKEAKAAGQPEEVEGMDDLDSDEFE